MKKILIIEDDDYPVSVRFDNGKIEYFTKIFIEEIL